MLFRNSKLQDQVRWFQRDIDIHKEVEAELAKRSHFCQKIIRRLKERVKELESTEIKAPVETKNVTGKTGEVVAYLEARLEEAEQRFELKEKEVEQLLKDKTKLDEMLVHEKSK